MNKTESKMLVYANLKFYVGKSTFWQNQKTAPASPTFPPVPNLQ